MYENVSKSHDHTVMTLPAFAEECQIDPPYISCIYCPPAVQIRWLQLIYNCRYKDLPEPRDHIEIASLALAKECPVDSFLKGFPAKQI